MNTQSAQEKSKPSDPLLPTIGPELIFGMIGPVGSNLKQLCKTLTSELKSVGYTAHEVRLSEILKTLKPYKNLSSEPENRRIADHMRAGTELREKTGKETRRGDILSLMAVAKIREIREKQTADPNSPAPKTAYILNSLKHPDEVRALRAIYGRLFVLVSAYLPREKRISNLARAISTSNRKPADIEKFRSDAEALISRDEQEGKDLGQDVGGAFPEADLFVSTESVETIKKSVSRFVEILFAYPFHTPFKDEMGMYFAKSAALRSADLSRQVGAVVANSTGDIVSVGCNEVPCAGGGQYWPSEDDQDHRDFKIGYDSSAISKIEIIRELVSSLEKLKIFRKGMKAIDISKALAGDEGEKAIKGTQIQNLLEFGRPVHAEMSALTTAARLGVSVKGATLYSTTFPCHMCARHIISSGIARVVYIEPYPKSRVRELYEDSVVVDSEHFIPGKVNFQPFVGISPLRYQEFFEKVSKRKEKSGAVVEWDKGNANPRVQRLIYTYVELEKKVIEFVNDLLTRTGFR